MDATFDEIEVKDMLQQKLDSLRRNREHISKEDLNGRYRKSYHALLSEINNLAYQRMDEIMFRWLVEEKFVHTGHEMMKRLLKENQKNLVAALQKEYSVKNFSDICQQIFREVMDAYLDQWVPEDGTCEDRYTLNPFQITKIHVKTK